MRLGKNYARDRARQISQMPVDKKIRLEKRKVTLANESCERRAARLECVRQRLEADTPEQRFASLEQMSTLQQQCLEVETPERRASRLECMRQRLEAETPEQRVARLEQMSTLQQQRLEVRRLLSVLCEAK